MLNKLASSIDERLIRDLIVLLQTAVAVKDQAASQAVGARLAGVAHVTGEMGTPTYIARHMGEAAALGGGPRGGMRPLPGGSGSGPQDPLPPGDGTLEVHVKHALNKLGLRSQVAAWAACPMDHYRHRQNLRTH